MPGPTLVLSDTHLTGERDHPRCVDALRPLWRDHEVSQLVINGDLAEVQEPDCRKQSIAEVERLRDLCSDDGVKLVLISGNHDAHLTDCRHVFLCNERVLVTHGDVLHPAVCPWVSVASEVLRRTNESMQRLAEQRGGREHITLEDRLAVSQEAGHFAFVETHLKGEHGTMRRLMRLHRLPWLFHRVTRYWREAPDYAADFLERYAPQASVLICGHTHRPGAWHRSRPSGEKTYLNTGSFTFPGHPRGVFLHDDGNLRIHRIRRDADFYKFDVDPVSTFSVTERGE